jgi:hypothetical protein
MPALERSLRGGSQGALPLAPQVKLRGGGFPSLHKCKKKIEEKKMRASNKRRGRRKRKKTVTLSGRKERETSSEISLFLIYRIFYFFKLIFSNVETSTIS